MNGTEYKGKMNNYLKEVKENIFQIQKLIMVIGRLIKKMEKENQHIKIEQNIMVILKMMDLMEMEK